MDKRVAFDILLYSTMGLLMVPLLIISVSTILSALAVLVSAAQEYLSNRDARVIRSLDIDNGQ